MIGVQSAQSRSLTVLCVRVVQVFIAAVAVYKLGPARPKLQLIINIFYLRF